MVVLLLSKDKFVEELSVEVELPRFVLLFSDPLDIFDLLTESGRRSRETRRS